MYLVTTLPPPPHIETSVNYEAFDTPIIASMGLAALRDLGNGYKNMKVNIFK